jgi:zinc protease
MINRTLAPTITAIHEISFTAPKIIPLNEQVNLFWMNEIYDETTRIELHFDAGTIRSEEKVAGFVNSLLLSGTATKNSTTINNELDSLGVFTDIEVGQEIAIVSIYCLRKNAEKAFSIVLDAITNVSFHAHEIEDIVREKKQNFLIGSEKVSILARREFQASIFNNSAAYSRQLKLEDFENLTKETLNAFHKEHYLHGLVKVLVVSRLENDQIDTMVGELKKMCVTSPVKFENDFVNKKGRIAINKEGAMQTAIRIGMPLFNKKNPDFIDFQILQTILGDYFGSRLMSNIREDKGYTYGIGCGVSETYESGHFIIATEVGKEYVEATLNEIKYEIERLQKEEVDTEELTLVKNYLLGQLLKSADGPNAMTDLFIGAYNQGKDLTFYQDVINRINTITSEDLKLTAEKYIKWENLTIVTAG